MFKLDLQSRLPIYEQLKTQICELIMLGELAPDEPLPSVRSIARELGINPNTVQKAYQELERERVIYSVAGRGSYISPDAGRGGDLRRRQLEALEQAARKVRSCGIREAEALDAVRRAYDGPPQAEDALAQEP